MALGPDSSSVAMYYTLHGGQPYAGAFKRVVGMEALKHTEQFVRVFHVEAYSVIPNEYYYMIWFLVPAANCETFLAVRQGRSLGQDGD